MKKSNLVSNSLFKKAKLCLVFLLALTCLFLAITPPIISANAQTETTQIDGTTQTDNANQVLAEEQDDQEVVFSYMDVFEVYYETAKENLSQRGIEANFTFEEFCEGYYAQGFDIATYVNAVTEEITTNPTATFSEVSQNISTYSNLVSADAEYILSSTYYDTTPASEFEQQPIYLGFDYSSLLIGDIVYETDTIFFDAGHNAIINNLQKNSDYGYYIQTIESVGGGVQYGFLDDARIIKYQVLILRVKNSTTNNRESAIYFCQQQLGKPYDLNLSRKQTSINSSGWYCSELIYAAYKYTGLDISLYYDNNGNIKSSIGCKPDDIYNSYNTYTIPQSDYFIDLAIVSKSGATWTLKITNKRNSSIYCMYNTKMCSSSDAQNWKNLKHVSTIYLTAKGSTTIEVDENLFATHVAFCYLSSGTRLVTYANNLNKTKKTLTLGYNITNN